MENRDPRSGRGRRLRSPARMSFKSHPCFQRAAGTPRWGPCVGGVDPRSRVVSRVRVRRSGTERIGAGSLMSTLPGLFGKVLGLVVVNACCCCVYDVDFGGSRARFWAGEGLDRPPGGRDMRASGAERRAAGPVRSEPVPAGVPGTRGNGPGLRPEVGASSVGRSAGLAGASPCVPAEPHRGSAPSQLRASGRARARAERTAVLCAAGVFLGDFRCLRGPRELGGSGAREREGARAGHGPPACTCCFSCCFPQVFRGFQRTRPAASGPEAAGRART